MEMITSANAMTKQYNLIGVHNQHQQRHGGEKQGGGVAVEFNRDCQSDWCHI
jgi:hypothetical protein